MHIGLEKNSKHMKKTEAFGNYGGPIGDADGPELLINPLPFTKTVLITYRIAVKCRA